MASEHVREFTEGNFESEVLQSSEPVLVDFWAEWCQPCRLLGPTIDALAERFDGQVKVGKIDTDAQQQVAVKYGISAIPTVILFKGGEPVKKFVGLTSEDDLAAAMTDAAG